MDLLQEQVNALNSKLDTLQKFSEQLASQMLEALSELKTSISLMNDRPQSYGEEKSSVYRRLEHSSLITDHKDVLMDADCLTNDQSSERELAPEIQVRRLTAQLTAAYNRIAALEEQLVAKRVR